MKKKRGQTGEESAQNAVKKVLSKKPSASKLETKPAKPIKDESTVVNGNVEDDPTSYKTTSQYEDAPVDMDHASTVDDNLREVYYEETEPHNGDVTYYQVMMSSVRLITSSTKIVTSSVMARYRLVAPVIVIRYLLVNRFGAILTTYRHFFSHSISGVRSFLIAI